MHNDCIVASCAVRAPLPYSPGSIDGRPFKSPLRPPQSVGFSRPSSDLRAMAALFLRDECGPVTAVLPQRTLRWNFVDR
jgi:hypothetical protein